MVTHEMVFLFQPTEDTATAYRMPLDDAELIAALAPGLVLTWGASAESKAELALKVTGVQLQVVQRHVIVQCQLLAKDRRTQVAYVEKATELGFVPKVLAKQITAPQLVRDAGGVE